MKKIMKPLLVFSEASPTTCEIIICLTVFLMMFTTLTFSQSVMEFEAGTSLTNDSGADISADVIIMNGTYSGGGTINGSAAYILNVTLLLEGFYNSSTDIMVSDTVSVNLRSTSSPYAVVDASDCYLSSAGAGTCIFPNAVNGTNYYLDIRHRNSIETWSAAGQSFTTYFMVYDFSNANTQAYGNNMTQIDASPVKFGIYSGDVNQDGVVDLIDGSLIDNDAYNFVTGYVASDCNGDDVVDLSDAALQDNNAYDFVTMITP